MVVFEQDNDIELNATINDIQEDSMCEIISHFALQELDEIRKVSSTFQQACNKRKAYIFSLLKVDKAVEIIGLTSKKGMQLNHRLAVIDGRLNAGRYATKILHLTGEVERIGLRPQCLNPFLSQDQEIEEKSRLSFINYSSDARLREGHGRLIDQVLMLLRYCVNVAYNHAYYQGGFREFFSLSRSDRVVSQLNSQIFSLYRVIPSTIGLDSPQAEHEDYSVLDNTIRAMISMIPYEEYGKMANYERDGNNGELILRNFIRFMNCWDTERINGHFWISKIVSSGTLVVQDCDGKLGNVYLVKGIGSQVGEDVEDYFPFLISTTLLPLYNMFVYDGILSGGIKSAGRRQREQIQSHISKAVREQSVVYCCNSAEKGLWDDEPPQLPTFEDVPKEEAEDEEEEGAYYNPTEYELKLASLLMTYAKEIKFESAEEGNRLLVRRFGWTKRENPDQKVGLLFTDNSHPEALYHFCFNQWPCYTLEELLSEALKKCMKDNEVPCIFWIDELSLVPQLKRVLKLACQSIDFDQIPGVEYYPPPSEEERAYVAENDRYDY